MRLPLFQVDAFTDTPFTGNPAAVVPLQKWIPDSLMQAIAAENNQSETAFFSREGSAFKLRWFSPTTEISLCGHATMASAHVLLKHSGWFSELVQFHTRSGVLKVQTSDDDYIIDLPGQTVTMAPANQSLSEALGLEPLELWAAADDYLVVLKNEAAVCDLKPDIERLRSLDKKGVIVTAPGDDMAFVSRSFFPQLGINEDPVTGASHCILAPYWGNRLGAKAMRAAQLSARGGRLWCEARGDRVLLRGKAVTYLIGAITVPDMES